MQYRLCSIHYTYTYKISFYNRCKVNYTFVCPTFGMFYCGIKKCILNYIFVYYTKYHLYFIVLIEYIFIDSICFKLNPCLTHAENGYNCMYKNVIFNKTNVLKNRNSCKG